MPTEMIRQTKFTTGEVDETTWKRTEVQEYLTAAQSLLNCEVGTTGLAKKRRGTDFLLEVNDYVVSNSKMYEFVDKNTNYYIAIATDEKFNIFSTNGTTLIFVQEVVTPYTDADLDDIDYSQDNDSLVLTHPSYPPARIYVSDYGTLTFAFQYLNIYPLPAYDFNRINYNSYTVSLSVAGDQLTFEFTGVGANPGFTDAWVGGQIVGGGATDLDPIGYAIITAVSYAAGGGGVVTFTATIQIAFKSSGYATKGSQYSVKQPAWSPTTTDTYGLGYPEAVAYYQNRLWLANTKTLNNTIFGSKINTPISFDVGTGADTDAIVYTIGQSDSGEILWLNGGKQLEIFTQSNEYAAPQDQNAGLTPSTFSIRKQSSYGSSTILKPQTYINNSYFAARTGKSIINYNFQGVGLAYTATNVSVASAHLIKNPRNRALLQGSDTSQDNFIYFLNPSDNTLTTFQFAEEYKLAAYTPIVFANDVTLVDIVTVNNQVYLLKYYEMTETYTVEIFNTDTKIDSSTDTTMDIEGLITGLDRFDGYTIQVVYQDQDYGQYLVEDGEVIVDKQNENFGAVSVGLLYDVEVTPMYLFAGENASPFFKSISTIYVDYYQSLNFFINGKLIPYQNFAAIQASLPLQPQTGTAIIYPVDGWDRFSTFSITQSSPFDLQILSVAYQIEMAKI